MKVREALHLAAEHLAQNRPGEAEALYRQVLAASPRNATALVGMGKIGIRSGHVAEAAEMLRRALAVNPNDVEARAALAEALHRTGKRDEAEALFAELLASDPNCFPALSRFGTSLSLASDFARAEPLLRRVAELAPNSYFDQHRQGLLLCYLNRPREAVAVLERATPLCPDDANAHMALGQAFMYAQDFLQGLREMEWRWKLPGPEYPNPPYPRWDGKVVAGKTLLVVSEEGFGDVIQFAGFLPELAEAGMNVVLSTRAGLLGLFGSLRGVKVIEDDQTPPGKIDFWIPLLSIPLARGITTETLRLPAPWLAADAEKIAWWKQRLGDGFHVGLAWSGNPTYAANAQRSIPLSRLAPLANVPGVQLHSLHIAPEAQQEIAQTGLPVRDHTDAQRDFSDTAAMMGALDLVISIDSSALHLAGALARPAWLLLHHEPNARWMLHRRDTPFYPTARLFRQSRAGDWASVIEEARNELIALTRDATG